MRRPGPWHRQSVLTSPASPHLVIVTDSLLARGDVLVEWYHFSDAVGRTNQLQIRGVVRERLAKLS